MGIKGKQVWAVLTPRQPWLGPALLQCLMLQTEGWGWGQANGGAGGMVAMQGQTVAQKLLTARPRLLSTGTKGKEVRSPPGSRGCGRAVYCSSILQSCVAYKGMLKS